MTNAALYFTFNSVASTTMGLHIIGIDRPAAQPVEPLLLTVPGRPGAYLQGDAHGVRTITVEAYVDDTDMQQLTTVIEMLPDYLIQDTPKTLVFSDDTSRCYYAKVSGEIEVEYVHHLYRRVTITFVCPDPFAYDTSETDNALLQATNTVYVPGAQRAFPRFVLPFKKNATWLKLTRPATSTHGRRTIQLGEAPGVDGTEDTPDTWQLTDDCSSTSGWSTGTKGPGAIAGTMVSDGASFSPKHSGGSFGTGAAWHGPSLRKGLSAAATDFNLYVLMRMSGNDSPYSTTYTQNFTWTGTEAYEFTEYGGLGEENQLTHIERTDTHAHIGRENFNVYVSSGKCYIQRTGTGCPTSKEIEVTYRKYVGRAGAQFLYLLDASDNTLAWVGILDSKYMSDLIFRAGTTTGTIYDGYGAPGHRGDYDNLTMRLTLERRGTKWRFSGRGLNSAGQYTMTWVTPWYTGPSADVAKLEINISQYGSHAVSPYAQLENVALLEIGTPSATNPPVIFELGDTVEVDCEAAVVRKNGVPCMEHLTLDSQFFDVPVGNSSIVVESRWDAINEPYAHMYVRGRYL